MINLYFNIDRYYDGYYHFFYFFFKAVRITLGIKIKKLYI